ncbi:hypothetical protein Ddc_11280 [Ditylenchus destructor]|nr:hypothetical protein Ddc_11280 [Ditylenchus destructor]
MAEVPSIMTASISDDTLPQEMMELFALNNQMPPKYKKIFQRGSKATAAEKKELAAWKRKKAHEMRQSEQKRLEIRDQAAQRMRDKRVNPDFVAQESASQLIENLSPQQQTRRRQSQRMESLTPEQQTHRRESRVIENFTPEQQTRRRESQRMKNLTPEQQVRKRISNSLAQSSYRQNLTQVAREIIMSLDRQRHMAYSQNLPSSIRDLLTQINTQARQSQRERQRNAPSLYRKGHLPYNAVFLKLDRGNIIPNPKFGLHATHGHYTVGPFDQQCSNCEALHFRCEKPAPNGTYQDCCNHGKITRALMGLEPSTDYPTFVKKLFIDGNRPFLDNVRYINNNFAMASIAVDQHRFQTAGSFCFKISGQVFRSMNLNAIATQTNNSRGGQVFMLDTREAMAARMPGLDKKSGKKPVDPIQIENLQKWLSENNLLAQSYLMMSEEIKEQDKKYQGTGRRPPDVKLLFSLFPGVDKNRYNLPRQNEIAAVFVPQGDGEVPKAYLTVNERGSGVRVLPHLNENAEGMMYPLLNMFGKPRWHPNRTMSNKKSLSLCDYTNFFFHYRPGEYLESCPDFNPLHHCV